MRRSQARRSCTHLPNRATQATRDRVDPRSAQPIVPPATRAGAAMLFRPPHPARQACRRTYELPGRSQIGAGCLRSVACHRRRTVLGRCPSLKAAPVDRRSNRRSRSVFATSDTSLLIPKRFQSVGNPTIDYPRLPAQQVALALPWQRSAFTKATSHPGQAGSE